jgi:hypothetical protein
MPSRRGLAHFRDDYPFRLEVTPQARREIGHAVTRENGHELRIFLSRARLPAALQHVAPTARTMSPRRTVDIGWNKPTVSEHFNRKGKGAGKALGKRWRRAGKWKASSPPALFQRPQRFSSALSLASQGSYQSEPAAACRRSPRSRPSSPSRTRRPPTRLHDGRCPSALRRRMEGALRRR